VGIDGGGTKTACAIATPEGAALGHAVGGPSNYQTVGAAATRAALEGVLREAAQRAGWARAAGGPLEVTGLCLALAGVDRPADRRAITQIVADLLSRPVEGLRWTVEAARVVVVNDAVAALVGGVGRKVGVVTVAGTGSIAFGRNARGEERRAGGWGYLLGDEGSGYAIGLAALRAVCRAADGRGPATRLTEHVLREHRLAQPSDLIAKAYGAWQVPDIAALAPLVERAASEGDAVARAVLDAAAAELALAAGAVIRGLQMAETPVDVVTVGGVWAGSPRVTEQFAAQVRSLAPLARVVRPRDEPVAGAVLLARESIGTACLD
jgi:N-acetylglucosamine kinase